MIKWTYICSGKDCKNGIVSKEYITDDELILFDTKEEAFTQACDYAEEEANYLNEGSVYKNEVTFGVPEDKDYQSMDEVKVCYYDDNNESELVTRRSIRAVKGEKE